MTGPFCFGANRLRRAQLSGLRRYIRPMSSRISRITTGMEKVNATVSFSRKKVLSSTAPRESPSRSRFQPPPQAICGKQQSPSRTRICRPSISTWRPSPWMIPRRAGAGPLSPQLPPKASLLPSFPRKRESKSIFQWMPAFAGMTPEVFFSELPAVVCGLAKGTRNCNTNGPEKCPNFLISRALRDALQGLPEASRKGAFRTSRIRAT